MALGNWQFGWVNGTLSFHPFNHEARRLGSIGGVGGACISFSSVYTMGRYEFMILRPLFVPVDFWQRLLVFGVCIVQYGYHGDNSSVYQ